MNHSSIFIEAIVLLASTVVTVPIAKRLGLGSVIGFLIGGVIIGPWGLRLISNYDSILHFAELGIVFLLFIIGLEILPKRLWAMRMQVFGLGGGQVLITTTCITLLMMIMGMPLVTALVAAVGASLSSTAFALQMLAEKNQLSQPHGQRAFSILLFQDIAIIPILAILPVLTLQENIDGISWLQKAMVIMGVGLGGHYLLRPFFRYIASIHNQEVFTAGALLVVLGVAGLMNWAGISMALGAFMAGVLLADSEYRHELEATIEPIKGLLMGLFFTAVGMSINLDMMISDWHTVLVLLVSLLLIKLLVLEWIGKVSGLKRGQARLLGIMLSQTGEFAFVLFTLGQSQGAISDDLFQLLMLVVALSMVSTPLMLFIHDRWAPFVINKKLTNQGVEESGENGSKVILVGFGRYGEIIARVLMSKNISMVALDTNPKQIEFVKRFGSQVFYGDATRIDVLKAAGAESAKLLIIAIDDRSTSLKIARIAKKHFENLKVFARAQDRYHAYQLIDIGVDLVNRETFESSLEMAKEVLMEMDLPDSVISETLRIFKYQDQKLLWKAAGETHDMKSLIQLAEKKHLKKPRR